MCSKKKYYLHTSGTVHTLEISRKHAGNNFLLNNKYSEIFITTKLSL